MRLNRTRSLCVALALCLLTPVARGQAIPAESVDEARIDKLLQQMTIEEKMNLIRGGVEDASVYQGQAGYLPGAPRLPIKRSHDAH